MLEEKPDALGARNVDELHEGLEALTRDGGTCIALSKAFAHVAHSLVWYGAGLFAPAHLQGAGILGRYPRIGATQHIDEGLEGRIIARLYDCLERKERSP